MDLAADPEAAVLAAFSASSGGTERGSGGDVSFFAVGEGGYELRDGVVHVEKRPRESLSGLPRPPIRVDGRRKTWDERRNRVKPHSAVAWGERIFLRLREKLSQRSS